MLFRFGDYTLDTERYELRDGNAPVPIQPQVFDLLAFLVEHHTKVMTKQELMDYLWPDGFVSDAALTTRLMEARKAIGDTGRDQRAIRTVHGRGYHFVLPVTTGDALPKSDQSSEPDLTASPPPARSNTPFIVGRDAELEQLNDWLNEAVHGERRLLFVVGEAGLGKTTLISAFLSELSANNYWIGQGNCLDLRDIGAAHGPLLDALGQLTRGPEGQRVVELLSRLAPSWLLQTPSLLSDDELKRLRERTVGVTHDRVLREFVELVEELARIRPVILILEDLHWSDSTTIDFLSWIAHRTDPSRLLVIGTYRPSEVRSAHHPLDQLQHELRYRSTSQSLALSLLTESAIGEYLRSRFANLEAAPAISENLFRRTEGNPLFVSTVVNEWLARGWIRPTVDGWRIDTPIDQLTANIPETLRQFVEGQLERLDAGDLATIEAAAVVGPAFASSAVAAALDLSDEEVEATCFRLARQWRFLREAGSVDWPDGTFAGRFEFLHGLYQEIAYQLVQPGRRARIHRQIADRLERGYGRRAEEHSVELASHFARGRDVPRALPYLLSAADSAMLVGAPREATQHLAAGLDLLNNREDLADQAGIEVAFRSRLGMASMVSQGFGSSEAHQSFIQAFNLASQRQDWTDVMNVGFSLASLLEYQSKYQEAAELLNDLPADALSKDPPLQITYHALHSCSAFHQGLFRESVDQADRGTAIHGQTGSPSDGRYAFLGADPVVGCREWSSLALWFLGYPDQAKARIAALFDLASAPGRRYSLASANSHAARLHQLLGDHRRARDAAAEAARIASEHGLAYQAAVGQTVEGWAIAMLGDAERGLAGALLGLEAHSRTGAMMDRPYFLSLIAEIHQQRADFTSALMALDDAIGSVGSGRPFFYEAELHRIRGTILERAGTAAAAESCFREALIVARNQEALSLELRAATSLYRLLVARGDTASARSMLQPIYERFIEGLDTPDLRAARALVSTL